MRPRTLRRCNRRCRRFAVEKRIGKLVRRKIDMGADMRRRSGAVEQVERGLQMIESIVQQALPIGRVFSHFSPQRHRGTHRLSGKW